MTQANIHEAKSKLSQLVDLAHSGEVVVIAKAGKPYVDIVPHRERKAREPGGYVIELHDIGACDADIEQMFHGDKV